MRNVHKLALEDLKSRDGHQGERLVWEKTEKGKQSELARTGSCTTGRDLECEDNKGASLNQHKRLAAFKCTSAGISGQLVMLPCVIDC